MKDILSYTSNDSLNYHSVPIILKFPELKVFYWIFNLMVSFQAAVLPIKSDKFGKDLIGII